MLTYFKSFIKWAQGRKYAINEEYFSFNPKLPKAKKEVRYLELEELYNYLIDNYIQIDWDNSITHFDAVTEFYIKQDPKLMNFIEKHYTDNEIIELVLPIKKTLLSKSKN